MPMAEQLKEFPNHNGRKSRWAEYLDGKIWKLSLKETNTKSVASLRSSITYGAMRMGLKVRTQQVDDTHLVVQSYE